ncbi:MAG TPA: hypothetical protein VG796_30190 [Verrucomicrobiales bacterium]|nr:hypothetical protein [Verrucomicrobiales bacterium]
MNADITNFSRRRFCRDLAMVAGATLLGDAASAQEPGQRPAPCKEVTVLNPRNRVPVGFIVDDSTCLVNLNKFAMPQFNHVYNGQRKEYLRDWKSWPSEIPDAFVRKFGEWAAETGVKGKYSIVPYPACVGRVDRMLPGWTQKELEASLDLVRTVMMPNWDIHPEMVTHTRIIDLKTGHPYEEFTPRFMENWDWTTGRSADEIGSYMAYALQILKNAGLPCEGLTTPGGFCNRARPQLAQGAFESVRSVFKAEIPHYFRDIITEGFVSVAPLVQNARDLDTDDPKCVVHVQGCTGDWTGGWDNVEPVGVDAFITPDLQSGRMVQVISRGQPAIMLGHWTGIFWNGQEKGFKVLQEVVKRLHARFDNLLWMKLSAVARYWAAKELTAITADEGAVRFKAPWACPDFTVDVPAPAGKAPQFAGKPLAEAASEKSLKSGTWIRGGEGRVIACFDLPKGASGITF